MHCVGYLCIQVLVKKFKNVDHVKNFLYQKIYPYNKGRCKLLKYFNILFYK